MTAARAGFTTACVLGLFAVTVIPAHAEEKAWGEVATDVLCSRGFPCAYVLVDKGAGLLIGAPRGADVRALKQRGVERIDLVLLTHHHRDSSEQAAALVAAGIPVRASKKAETLLTPEGAREFWTASMPVETPNRFPPLFERFWSKWSYQVHPLGIAGIRCDLEGGQILSWGGWKIHVIATPGHSPDHLAFVARRAQPDSGPVIAFCGDALSHPGKIWAPYTTDWHHVNDDGLLAAAESLKTLAAAQPNILCPEHGPSIKEKTATALADTADLLRKAGQLKSFHAFNKTMDGPAPKYAFLADDQVSSANPQGNPKPWTKLSPHLFLTGNTFALASKDGPVLLVDPYALNLVQRVQELRRDHGVGPVEVVMVSHAHNDHYTGIFALPKRESFQVWVLDRIADVIGNPGRFRAPYVDARIVKTDRRLKHEETVTWREYRLKIYHLPGQTLFAMGLEVDVDGKKCLFTGDNFYHVDQYTGSGGWSGMNRGLPGGYARSAQLVLDIRPDWVLAEHGGAFEFNAEDFRRRVRWAKEAAAVADALSPSGNHTHDWDPHRLRVEPFIVPAIPGRTVKVHMVVNNPLGHTRQLKISCMRPEIVLTRDLEVEIPPRVEKQQEIELNINSNVKPGRHIIPFVAWEGDAQDAADTFFVLQVE